MSSTIQGLTSRLQRCGWSYDHLGGGTRAWVKPDPDVVSAYWQIFRFYLDPIMSPTDEVLLTYFEGPDDDDGTLVFEGPFRDAVHVACKHDRVEKKPSKRRSRHRMPNAERERTLPKTKRKPNQGEVLYAKQIVDAATEYSEALRQEMRALEPGSRVTQRELIVAQEQSKAARRKLRSLIGGRRQLYGSMIGATGGAALGSAVGGVVGAAVGALGGALGGQLLLRPQTLAVETEGRVAPPTGRARPPVGRRDRSDRDNREYRSTGAEGIGARALNPDPDSLFVVVRDESSMELWTDDCEAVARFDTLEAAVYEATLLGLAAELEGHAVDCDVVALDEVGGLQAVVWSTNLVDDRKPNRSRKKKGRGR